MMSGSDPECLSKGVDLTLALHHRTVRAVLVSELGDAAKGIWLPLSQVEIEDLNKTVSGFDARGQAESVALVKVLLPEWLAIERRLV